MASQRPFSRRLRILVERLVLLLTAVMLLRTWFVDPCRVAGGSMAPTLLGRHRNVTCKDCGHRFVCGSASRPVAAKATCPNCDFADNRLDALPDAAGELLLMDRSVFHFRRPKRWEVVAFRRAAQASKIHVKRVVGLPGESIQIRHGDVYVNGKLQRKTLPQQRAMAILVHDADRRPSIAPVPPLRWRAESEDILWHSVDGRFAHAATSGEKLDLLEYRHWSRQPGEQERVRPCPVTDLCGYNQARPRRVEGVRPVSDLLLSLRLVKTRGQGPLILRATDGHKQFEVRIYPSRNRYETMLDHEFILGGTGKLPADGDELTVEVSLFDSQFLLALGGRTVVTYAYDRAADDAAAKPTSRPLAIGSRGLEVTIRDLRVYRDVYYTAPIGLRGRWGLGKPAKLGEDEYFVLGDNSPISEDSRTWPEGPAVAAKLLVGKPLLVHYPSQPWVLGERVFQVPDPAKIRYIR